jgi:hypothetical protein
MKRMEKRGLVVAVALTAACASAPRPPPWIPAAGDYTARSGRFTVRLPNGWMLHPETDSLIASRDGVFLQRIDVRTHEVGKPLGSTKKVFARGMLPQEAAEVVQDAIVSSPGMQGASLIENGPAEVAGRPGFKLAFAYKDGDGLKTKAVVYGVLAGDSVYELMYRAPERYYFSRDVDTFEAVRASFRISPDVAGARGAQ